MGTTAVYGSLEEAVRQLNTYSDELEQPTQTFLTGVQQRIGATGEGDAWTGEAAAQVVSTLETLHNDLVALKAASRTFATNVGISLTNYEAQDQAAQAAVNSVIGN
jgi:uncharacterized protein YukE